MKKVLIAIIGSNNAYGCPLHTNHQAFDAYFRALTDKGVSVIGKRTFDSLPSKSPPFSCRITYIVSPESLSIDPRLTKTFVVASLAELFKTIAGNGSETLFIFLDAALYEELFTLYKDDIDSIIVGRLHQPFESAERFEDPSLFEWRPRLMYEMKSRGKRSPGFTVHEYTKQFLHI